MDPCPSPLPPPSDRGSRRAPAPTTAPSSPRKERSRPFIRPPLLWRSPPGPARYATACLAQLASSPARPSSHPRAPPQPPHIAVHSGDTAPQSLRRVPPPSSTGAEPYPRPARPTRAPTPPFFQPRPHLLTSDFPLRPSSQEAPLNCSSSHESQHIHAHDGLGSRHFPGRHAASDASW